MLNIPKEVSTVDGDTLVPTIAMAPATKVLIMEGIKKMGVHIIRFHNMENEKWK